MATAVARLGVAHPPGYALFIVAAHLWWRALPWLEPAAAVGVFCALLAAAASAVAFVTAVVVLDHERDLAASGGRALRPATALAATLAFALGPLWWGQANLATAHALNLLLAAVLCLFLARAYVSGLGEGGLIGAAFVGGLAATHHLTLVALPLAGCAAAVFANEPSRSWRAPRGVTPKGAPEAKARTVAPRAAVGIALALIVGLMPWPALALLASRGGGYGWGDATSLTGVLDLILARQYHDLLGNPDGMGWLTRLANGVWSVAAEAGPIGFPAALAGLALLSGRARVYSLFVALLAGLDLAFFAAYGARDVESYLLPLCVAAIPAAALGLRALAEAIARWRPALPSGGVAHALVALVVAAALMLNGRLMDLSADREAIDYARGALAEAPPRALILSETDRHTFALWYAHLALGDRPDVALVDRWMLRWDWYRRRVARLYPDLRLPDEPIVDGARLAAGDYTDRPIVVTDPDDGWNTPIERGERLHRLLPARPGA